MSYAIVRNEKLTRAEAQGICVHNDRKAKNHTNKEIAPERTHLNCYLKKNELNYVKEFDKIKRENNLQGSIRSNSIIMCEMVFTSNKAFFDKIGTEETKRFFEESYKFACNYKNLGEKNIISAVVHYDEGTPHMHLIYIPVVHTKDIENRDIAKVCCRDFWKGRDSYRQLQNDYYKYITAKNFELERGIPSEETGAKHQKIEDLKKITNFENTKKVLENITLELPEVPDINDIKPIKLNKEKEEKEIIKPKDALIQNLYQDNIALHRELSRQARIVEEAEEYQKERDKIIADNEKLNDTVKYLEHEYKKKSNTLDLRYNNRKYELEQEFEDKIYNIENKYKKKICELERENNYLGKIIIKFEEKIEKFIHWICKKFDVTNEDNFVSDFQKETHVFLNLEKQLESEKMKIECEMER